MTPFRAVRVRAICAIAAILAFVGPVGCAADPAKPGAFAWRREKIEVANVSVTLMLAKAASPSPPPFLVVFASGDGGLAGVSMALLQHLAERSYCVVGFSSEEAFAKVVTESGGRANYVAARDSLASIIAQAKRALELPERTPIIVTGMSRGASVVVASAGDPTLRSGILGAIAIALTREFDDLAIGEVAKPIPGVERDEQGRIQTYPAIERLRSIPLAIIQSTNDSYVPSAESRRLLGPDTPTRRLYEVESRNHSFEGGEDALMRDLDDAMRWIGAVEQSSALPGLRRTNASRRDASNGDAFTSVPTASQVPLDREQTASKPDTISHDEPRSAALACSPARSRPNRAH